MSLGDADILSASLHLFMSWFYYTFSLLSVFSSNFYTYLCHLSVCHPREESYSVLITSKKCPGRIHMEGSWVICS